MKRIYTPARKKTILIVDDDQITLHLYQEKFRSQGYNVRVTDNDHSAVQTLRNEPIDLMILDLCLPGLDGTEVLGNIRSGFDVRALPVVVISNPYLGNLGRAALDAGATKCVTKSESTPGRMLNLVRELLDPGHSNVADATAKVALV